jgi:hypothetical protein
MVGIFLLRHYSSIAIVAIPRFETKVLKLNLLSYATSLLMFIFNKSYYGEISFIEDAEIIELTKYQTAIRGNAVLPGHYRNPKILNYCRHLVKCIETPELRFRPNWRNN